MKKAIVLSILLILGLLVVLAGVKGFQFKKLVDSAHLFAEPPHSVSAFEVQTLDWTPSLSTIGSLEALRGLDITADLSGRITEILFDAGSEVAKGDLLVRQDTSTEQAQLKAAQASAALAKNTLFRLQGLAKKNLASKADLDNALSAADTANADVENIEAQIEKKNIRAPFDGRLGIRLVNIGQSITAGQVLVSLQSTNKMLVNFSLPQRYFPRLKKTLLIELTVNAISDKTFYAIESEVDAVTRNIKLQAVLDNANQELLPGMFASLKLIFPDTKKVLLVPLTAIQFAAYGDSVFIIEADENDESKLVARQQFVRLGEAYGDFVIVEEGLSEGQKIVSAGEFKLRNGSSIAINESLSQTYSLTPDVADR